MKTIRSCAGEPSASPQACDADVWRVDSGDTGLVRTKLERLDREGSTASGGMQTIDDEETGPQPTDAQDEEPLTWTSPPSSGGRCSLGARGAAGAGPWALILGGLALAFGVRSWRPRRGAAASVSSAGKLKSPDLRHERQR